VQAENININETDVYLAYVMVQQFMTEFSSVATEKEKVAVITKAVFALLKNDVNNSSKTSENHSIHC
jgi:hypothetical protein